MNIMTVKHLGASLVLIGALAGCNTSKTPDAAPSASVPTDQAQVAATVPAEPAAATTQAPEAEASPLQIPDTADGIWLAIDKQSAELKAGKAYMFFCSMPGHASIMKGEIVVK